MKLKYFVWGLLSVLLGAGIYGYLEYNRVRPDSKNLRPKFSVEARDLLQEFETSEQEANKKYEGKNVIVAVTGVIKEVIKNEKGHYTILMGDTASLSSVRCAMDTAYPSGLFQMRRGNVITVKGNFNGYKADMLGVGADVELNFCVRASDLPGSK